MNMNLNMWKTHVQVFFVCFRLPFGTRYVLKGGLDICQNAASCRRTHTFRLVARNGAFFVARSGGCLNLTFLLKSIDCVGYQYPPDRSMERETQTCHQSKSVGAAARRRVSDVQKFIFQAA